MKFLSEKNVKKLFQRSSSRSKSKDKGKSKSGARLSVSESSSSSTLSYSTPRSVLQTEEEELREVFKVFDVDGDGRITADELGCVLSRLGDDHTAEELAVMVAAADANGDGAIDLHEFLAVNLNAASPAEDEAEAEPLMDAFRVFDCDRDGYISAEELHSVMRSLGDARCTLEDCRRMIGRVDQDGDGFVDFLEFRRMMLTPAY